MVSCAPRRYCSLDGICSECSAIEDSEKHDIQGILAADDNFTAFEICSGVQKLTNTTLVNTSSSGSSSSSSSTQSQIVGPTYCQVDESTAASSTSATSYATSDLSVALVYPDHDDSCLFHCLHDYADCTYFTAGIVDGTAICLLYLVDSCGNATNSPSEAILQLGNVAFSSLDTDPPILFRVLGENREEDTSAEGLAIGLAIFSAASVAVTYVSASTCFFCFLFVVFFVAAGKSFDAAAAAAVAAVYDCGQQVLHHSKNWAGCGWYRCCQLSLLDLHRHRRSCVCMARPASATSPRGVDGGRWTRFGWFCRAVVFDNRLPAREARACLSDSVRRRRVSSTALAQPNETVTPGQEQPAACSVSLLWLGCHCFCRYCDVIFVFIWDAVFFNVVPGWNSYVGALLVILSAIGIVLNKGRKEKLGVLQQAPLLKFGDCACCCGPDDLDGADGEVSHAHNARHHRDHRGGHIRGEARRQLELRRKLRAAVNAHSAGIHMLTFGRGHADGNATEKSPPLRAVVEGREDSTSSDFSSERESPSLLVL